MGKQKRLLTKDEVMDIGLNAIETYKQRIAELEAELGQQRKWAAAWKERAKTWRSHYYNMRAGHLAMVAKLEAELAKTKDESEGWLLQVKVAKEDLIPRLEAAEAELAELKARDRGMAGEVQHG